MNRILLLLIFSLSLSGNALGSIAPGDLQSAIVRGDYSAAEQMLRADITSQPADAQDHYVLAQVLAHENRLAEAKVEVDKALQIDDQISFTDASKFREFQSALESAVHAASSQDAAQTGATVTEAAHPQPATASTTPSAVAPITRLSAPTVALAPSTLPRLKSAPSGATTANALPPFVTNEVVRWVVPTLFAGLIFVLLYVCVIVAPRRRGAIRLAGDMLAAPAAIATQPAPSLDDYSTEGRFNSARPGLTADNVCPNDPADHPPADIERHVEQMRETSSAQNKAATAIDSFNVGCAFNLVVGKSGNAIRSWNDDVQLADYRSSKFG